MKTLLSSTDIRRYLEQLAYGSYPVLLRRSECVLKLREPSLSLEAILKAQFCRRRLALGACLSLQSLYDLGPGLAATRPTNLPHHQICGATRFT